MLFLYVFLFFIFPLDNLAKIEIMSWLTLDAIKKAAETEETVGDSRYDDDVGFEATFAEEDMEENFGPDEESEEFRV